MRICTQCEVEKQETEFNKKKSYYDGLDPWCRSCKHNKDKEAYKKNKDRVKAKASEYYYSNKTDILTRRKNDKTIQEYNKQYKLENKDYIKEYNLQYREDTFEERQLYKKEYREKNKDKIREYGRNKLKNDPLFKLAKKLRNRLRDYLKSNRNNFTKKSSSEYLGCSIEECKIYLENQFKEDMTWENHGSVWHIDHIIPLSFAKTEDQLYLLCHYTNLQPLFVLENLKKNNKIGTDVCWQKLIRDLWLKDDIKNGCPFDTNIKDFILNKEIMTEEHRKFIQKYEWLGNSGLNSSFVFTARYKGELGGVVIIREPYSYQFDKRLEALIQRGACSSWSPKNLGSKLVMFACRWMVNNTEKRIFTAYSDPEAGEIGTIYQACNFDYLGNDFGANYNYKLPSGKVVISRWFRRESTLKKLAKDLEILWDETLETKTLLKSKAKEFMLSCEKIKCKPKGKYVLLLKKTNKETLTKTWKCYPYPKRITK